MRLTLDNIRSGPTFISSEHYRVTFDTLLANAAQAGAAGDGCGSQGQRRGSPRCQATDTAAAMARASGFISLMLGPLPCLGQRRLSGSTAVRDARDPGPAPSRFAPQALASHGHPCRRLGWPAEWRKTSAFSAPTILAILPLDGAGLYPPRLPRSGFSIQPPWILPTAGAARLLPSVMPRLPSTPFLEPARTAPRTRAAGWLLGGKATRWTGF